MMNSDRPRILFVTVVPPWPPINGGYQRSALLYRAMKMIGDVDVIVAGWASAEPYVDTLRKTHQLVGYFPDGEYDFETATARVLSGIGPIRRSLQNVRRYLPRNRQLREWLAEHGDRYDLIVARYTQALSQLPTDLKQPIVLDFDDVDWELHRSQLNLAAPRWVRRARVASESFLIERAVKDLLRRCSHVWVTKDSDLAAVPHTRCSVLTNIPYTEPGVEVEPLPPATGQQIVFVGHLNFEINVRAIDHFIATIWPKIRARCPTAVFSIVGSHGKPETLARWETVEGVVVRGFVEDLRDAYRPAAISISPIWEGAGTKIKVLESLTFGRVCVATSHSARGLVESLGENSGVVISHTDDEMVERCVEMLNNPVLRDRLAAVGAADVRRLFSFEAFSRVAKADLERALQLTP